MLYRLLFDCRLYELVRLIFSYWPTNLVIDLYSTLVHIYFKKKSQSKLLEELD